MEQTVHSRPPLPVRAWNALRSRGPRYFYHKTLRRTLGRWPAWKRRLLYANARDYWTQRGGLDYFREQEGQLSRTQRADWIAERLLEYRPRSILEVGCGYGKLLEALRRRTDIPLTGVDFSPSQLNFARTFLADEAGISLVLGGGERLPFPDGAFDLVVTSAVILHNPPVLAERIREEVVRVANRYAAHNEETGTSYNRYGYDTAAWYRGRGMILAETGPIPMDPDALTSQFTVVDLLSEG